MKIENYNIATFLFLTVLLCWSNLTFAQAELMPWGDLNGIRIQGQLMDFKTSLNVVGEDWSDVKFSGKELQRPKFKRLGPTQLVSTIIKGLSFTKTVQDLGVGHCKVTISFKADADQQLTGVYLGVKWSNTRYSGKNFFHISPSDSAVTRSGNRSKDTTDIFLPIHIGAIKKGNVYEKSFVIKVLADLDHQPVEIKLNAANKGRTFDGLGGNFRLQNLKTDPQVIDYCLENLRVAWGRVEMPWKNWHSNLSEDPILSAKNGGLDKHVERSMLMAQRLGKMNIPVIVSAWSPPAWAVTGTLVNGQDANGIWGNLLNPAKTEEIYSSITSYLLYLKTDYGVEATYFSFNESDLGINVRQTPMQHAELIKGLGAYMKSKGLKTKLLLGDNSDANTYEFIYPALNDPACQQYIGAVSFHSWRGWQTATLQKWTDAAKKIGVDLLVGEGSIDAAAWQYPAYFEEESYALEEINLYTRLMNICQPLSILQWQLTADYSPLKGGGIFGDTGPLAPTQRFWQLKQLASNRKGERHIDAYSNRSDISAAALVGDANSATIHLVNNSAGRPVVLSGIPIGVKKFKVYVTDKTRNLVQLTDVVVKNGKANFQFDPRCYLTLVSE